MEKNISLDKEAPDQPAQLLQNFYMPMASEILLL